MYIVIDNVLGCCREKVSKTIVMVDEIIDHVYGSGIGSHCA